MHLDVMHTCEFEIYLKLINVNTITIESKKHTLYKNHSGLDGRKELQEVYEVDFRSRFSLGIL